MQGWDENVAVHACKTQTHTHSLSHTHTRTACTLEEACRAADGHVVEYFEDLVCEAVDEGDAKNTAVSVRV